MTVNTLLSGEELWDHPQRDRYELVRGELHEVTPPGGEHGEVACNAAYLVKHHVKKNKLGKVLVESGFYIERNPDTVRGPDVAFYSLATLPASGLPKTFVTFSPDLAIEIVSPNDSSEDVEEKVQEYLKAGVKRVWAVHPRTRSVYVYGPGATVRILHENDDLTGEDVLPGFQCKVHELFDQ